MLLNGDHQKRDTIWRYDPTALNMVELLPDSFIQSSFTQNDTCVCTVNVQYTVYTLCILRLRCYEKGTGYFPPDISENSIFCYFASKKNKIT